MLGLSVSRFSQNVAILSEDTGEENVKADPHPVTARDLQEGWLPGLLAVFSGILLLAKWILTVRLQRCRKEP